VPISYVVDRERNVVLVAWQGEVTEEDYRAHLRAMLTDPESLRTGRCLTDVTRANIRMSGAQLNDIGTAVALPLLAGRPFKTAVLAESTVNFGVARQYQILSQSESSDGVFRDRDAALAWLLKE